MAALYKNKAVRFHDDEVHLYEYTKTLNFSAWAKSKLAEDLAAGSSNFEDKPAKAKKILYKTKHIVFSDNDLDIVHFSEKLDLSWRIKCHLRKEMEGKHQNNETTEKVCIICEKLNLRRRVTCSEDCQKEHKRLMQINAEKARLARDGEKRKKYQRDRYRAKKAAKKCKDISQ